MLSLVRAKHRNPAQRLRGAVDALPERTQRAMLKGIDRNRIIVGAYTDPRSGGVCPMLAAHRNGGRTSLASFAIAWDAFTGARKPRLATRREVRTLRSYLEISLLRGEQGGESVTALAAQIRSERAELAARIPQPAPDRETAPAAPTARPPAPAPGEIRVSRSGELRDRIRFRVLRRARRDAKFQDLVAAAESELAGHR